MTERELNEVRALNDSIRNLNSKSEMLRDALINVVPARDGLPQAQTQNSRIEQLTSQILELEEELLELKKQCAAAKLKITSAICAANLSRKEAAVLQRRYVKCMRFRDIGFELNYSDAQVFRLHGSALKKMRVE